jgi:hypothetical protein
MRSPTTIRAGLAPDQVRTLVDHYESAQIDALKRALLGASLFALFALWVAGDLPGSPFGAATASERAPRRRDTSTARAEPIGP